MPTVRREHLLFLGLMASCAGSSPTPSGSTSDPAEPPEATAAAPEDEPFSVLLEEAASSTAAETAPEPEPAPELAPEPAPVRAGPLKLLILGDSMAATDFGRALEDALSIDPRITTARRGKSSTGLARPDFFDWLQEGPRQVKKHQPDLVLVILGGNDGQDLLGKQKGPRVFWGSKAWPAAYAERLRTLSSKLGAGQRQIVFLGLPLMARPHLEKKLKLIRGVQKRTFAAYPGTAYVDTRSCFLGPSGKPLNQVKVDGWRRPQPLRQDDGIHLSVPGARHFASCVRALLRPILDTPYPPKA